MIGGFLEVYHTLGFGHAERTYMNAMDYELRGRGSSPSATMPSWGAPINFSSDKAGQEPDQTGGS